MPLASRFIDHGVERDFLSQHFKKQLDKIPTIVEVSDTEKLRKLCADVSSKAEMEALWEWWLKIAREGKGLLQSIAKAYEAILEESTESPVSEWSDGDVKTIKDKFKQRFDDKLNELLAIEKARLQGQEVGRQSRSDLSANISWVFNRPHSSQKDAALIALLQESQPVTKRKEQKELEIKCLKEQNTISQQRQNKKTNSSSAVGQGLNIPRPTPVSCQRHVSPPLPSSSNSAASVVSPSDPGSLVSPGQSMVLPQSAFSSPNFQAKSAVEPPKPDRLAQDWQQYVMQEGRTEQGFGIKEKIEPKSGEERLTIRTHNDSTVVVKPQGGDTDRVKVTIARQVERSQAIQIAANMATVAYFNKMPPAEVAHIDMTQLVITSENEDFKKALKKAMAAYVENEKCKLQSAQSHSPSPDAVSCRVDRELPHCPLLNSPANFRLSSPA